MRDVIVIGSGFGGAVMAARLSAALGTLKPGSKVLVLEKGPDSTGGHFDPRSQGDGALNAQGNRFKHSLSPQYLSSIAQLHTDPVGAQTPGTPSMTVISGSGVGGGSQVYDGVSLRAPTEAFEQMREGRRLWPTLYSRSALAPYYSRVERRLNVVKPEWTDANVPHWQLMTKRDFVFAEGCRRIGATAVGLKIADKNDANEGWWNEGQRFEGRQSLTKNYLLDAKQAGAEFRAGCTIESVEPTRDGYVVRGTDSRTFAAIEEECRLLIVAGGSMGSTGLLLKSRERFTGTRDVDPHQLLGRHVSGNGDYGVTGVVGPRFELDVEGFKGKPMASYCPSFFREHQFILIPFYAAPLSLALGQFSTLLAPKNPLAVGRRSTEVAAGPDGKAERDWGLPYKQRLSQFGSRVLTMGCLALDACEGEIRLSANGQSTEVTWRQTAPSTERRWNAAVTAMRSIYEALGGEMYLDGYRKEGTVHTAHPLGGAPMATQAEWGVVDQNAESFTNPNLFVVDSAMIPSALGANPSLTIAAVAESIADRLVRGVGMKSLRDRLL